MDTTSTRQKYGVFKHDALAKLLLKPSKLLEIECQKVVNQLSKKDESIKNPLNDQKICHSPLNKVRLASQKHGKGIKSMHESSYKIENEIDEVLENVFPDERSLVKTRRILQRKNMKFKALEEAYEKNELNIIQMCNLLIHDENICILEQMQILKILHISSNRLLRYEMSLTDASKYSFSIVPSIVDSLLYFTKEYKSRKTMIRYDLPAHFPSLSADRIKELIPQIALGRINKKQLYDMFFKICRFQRLCRYFFNFETYEFWSEEKRSSHKQNLEWNKNKKLNRKKNHVGLNNKDHDHSLQITSLIIPKHEINEKLIITTTQNNEKSFHLHPTPRCLKSDQFYSPNQLQYEFQKSQQILKSIDITLKQSRDWIRDSCPSNILKKSSLYRYKFGVEKLQKILLKCIATLQTKVFHRIKKVIYQQKCIQQTKLYLQYKASFLLLSIARRKLYQLFHENWNRWKTMRFYQLQYEQHAACIIIQLFFRQTMAKIHVNSLRQQQASINIQRIYRGFYGRKMFIRRQRYNLFTKSITCIQRSFRSYLFRSKLQEPQLKHHHAKKIQRRIRIYLAKKELKRLKVYHELLNQCSCIITRFFKSLTAEKVSRLVEELIQNNAAIKLQRAWRRYKFLCIMLNRLFIRRQKEDKAAKILQAAYRAKVARVQYHALLDVFHEQKRQYALKMMWERDSVVRIQQWWKKLLKKWNNVDA